MNAKSDQLVFLDLFAGAGGLSEGFRGAGFVPIAHVESDAAACYTLKTRAAYHWLKVNGKICKYYDYLKGELTRNDLYSIVPNLVTSSVLNRKIEAETLPEICKEINTLSCGKKIDLIVGGPPCQAYSLVGRSRDENRMLGDKRNYLFNHYVSFLEHFKPKYFVFENVVGILSAKDDGGVRYFDLMREAFRSAGYETEYSVLSAKKFGVPQDRKRVILVGRLGTKTGFFPKLDECTSEVTIKELLGDLPALRSGQGCASPVKTNRTQADFLVKTGIKCDSGFVTWHVARPNTKNDLEIYKIAVDLWHMKKSRLNYEELPKTLQTHNNKSSFLDRFKVVAGDLTFSHTIVAHIAKDGHYYIHYDKWQNRSLTPREAARIQTFPDNYYFEGVNCKPARSPAFKQIGNAVPVVLAKEIGLKLMENWS